MPESGTPSAVLNSHFQTGLKNLLDKAVLEHEDEIESKRLIDRYLKYDEIPFDFVRRRMSVIVHEVLRGRDLLICKGAVEEAHHFAEGNIVGLAGE